MFKFINSLLISVLIFLLAACGSNEDLNINKVNTDGQIAAKHTLTNRSYASTNDYSSSLLSSLSQLYPGGQVPADRLAQAAQDLAQNVAVLKMTADTLSESKSTIQTQVSDFGPQAVAADFKAVQRVQNTTLFGAYFFSIYPTEVTAALAANPNWVLEGPAFWASLAAGVDLHPVHRFRNVLNGSYLYTIFESERTTIVANYSATYSYEGTAWYARQTATQDPGWSALYRFRNKTNGTYLFSADETEKEAIVANYPDIFVLEGIAYYVRKNAPEAARTPIAAGLEHTCAIRANGSVACWGRNIYGQLGNGGTINSSFPVAVTGLTNVKAIAAGDNHTCALTNTEEVRCWGRNAAGQLGNGTTTNSSTPVSVLFFAKALEAGGDATCAVNKPILQNTVNTFCWGSNIYGQLGDGTTTSRTIPSLIPGISGTTDVTVGFRHSCALKSDGTVSCWGSNSYGQLGNGNTVNRPTPIAVTGLTEVASIVAGDDHTCALKNNGTARCWGRGYEGQLGYGGVSNIHAPVYVLNSDGATALNGLSALTAGFAHTCGLKNDGTTKCWGNNAYGQLGDGTYTTRLLATTVTGLSGVTAINLGVDHTCALKNDGSAQCWGRNSYGQLGNTSVSNRNTPTSVTGGAIFWK